MSEQKPSIGRVVHYQKYGTPGGEHKSEPSAAVITKVLNEETSECQLFVMNPNGAQSWTVIEEIKALVKEKYPNACLAKIEMWDRYGISKYKVKGTFHAWFRKMFPKPTQTAKDGKV